jgi:pimeloyl-ACP methyl ester carboxylesterase
MTPIVYPFLVQHINLSNNIDIAYCQTGTGDSTLLFVHGLANYLAVWNEQLSGLQLHAQCISIDLPGNGLSADGDFPYSMDFYVDTVAEFIEKKKLQNVMVVGHSMGGQIALLMALKYPNLVSKIVLIASSGLESFNATEITIMEHMLDMGQLWGMDTSYLETSINQSFYSNNATSKIIVKELKQLAENQKPGEWHKRVMGNIKAMLREAVLPSLDKIKLPVLIIFGEHDAMIPNKLIHFLDSTKSIAQKASSLLENSEIRMIPHAGHFVQLEKFELVNESIVAFIAKK